MGECLLARGSGGSGASKDPLDNIPVVAGYCSILVTLKDSGGGLCSNMMVNCKDGSRWYNYKTNEQGMALFQCNSGSANFNCPNYYNDGSKLVYMADQAKIPSLVIDAPVGTKLAKEIMFNKVNSFNFAALDTFARPTSANVVFRDTTKITNLIMVGAGGRGGYGYYTDPYGTGWKSTEYGGGGGGGGAKNYAASVSIIKNQVYYLSVGQGGQGAGGTTSGFGYSANGGSAASGNSGGRGGIGLYSGGNGGNGWYKILDGAEYDASNSTTGINGAGGGGGGGGLSSNGMCGYTAGSSNGGGRGGNWSTNAINGTAYSGGGGGGGCGRGASSDDHSFAGFGGSGRLTFNM